MKSNGYSGTPLAKKLGIKEAYTIQVFNAPKAYLDFFREFPQNVSLLPEGEYQDSVDFIHIFATQKVALAQHFTIAKPNLKKSGILWISWPKKTSKIETDLDKLQIMKFGQDNGLVDTKVAAIDANWSGHKFVYRKKDR